MLTFAQAFNDLLKHHKTESLDKSLSEAIAYLSERSVQFVLFSGEEQGLLGSKYFVSQLGSSSWKQQLGLATAPLNPKEGCKSAPKIMAAVCMDMIGYSHEFYGVKIEGTKAVSLYFYIS